MFARPKRRAFHCHPGRRDRHLEISDSRKNLFSPDLMVFEEKLLSTEERCEFRLGQRRNIAVNERMQLGRTKPRISPIGHRNFRNPIRFASKRIGRQRDAPVSLALMYRHQVQVVVLGVKSRQHCQLLPIHYFALPQCFRQFFEHGSGNLPEDYGITAVAFAPI